MRECRQGLGRVQILLLAGRLTRLTHGLIDKDGRNLDPSV
jgi:hypothetical protein